jgi:hypothetical protein
MPDCDHSSPVGRRRVQPKRSFTQRPRSRPASSYLFGKARSDFSDRKFLLDACFKMGGRKSQWRHRTASVSSSEIVSSRASNGRQHLHQPDFAVSQKALNSVSAERDQLWAVARVRPSANQLSRKLLRTLDRLGCLSFRSALASICRMRSRVTENCCPTSSKV